MKNPGTEPDQTDLAIKAIEESLEPLKEIIESADLGLAVMIAPKGDNWVYLHALTNMPPIELLMSGIALTHDTINDNPELLYPGCEMLMYLLSELQKSMETPPNVGKTH